MLLVHTKNTFPWIARNAPSSSMLLLTTSSGCSMFCLIDLRKAADSYQEMLYQLGLLLIMPFTKPIPFTPQRELQWETDDSSVEPASETFVTMQFCSKKLV
ncbi:hypothetical protein O6H91_03G080800 [Diphasiastrum complanatum]|uniref:Uncharacterized protein n=1 Tax=Diphasiastrum complanatum TaxID=34168 RepID=A0ACC2E861_DIPCM|nr:hypothetical protein O6H91_03G080800 [Diphasiastrum complanatum]